VRNLGNGNVRTQIVVLANVRAMMRFGSVIKKGGLSCFDVGVHGETQKTRLEHAIMPNTQTYQIHCYRQQL
jgi:seryl-tRNA(Sec) selenium transferase